MLENMVVYLNEKKVNNSFFLEKKNIPSVMLLYAKNEFLTSSATKKIIKFITCQNDNKEQICDAENMCQNCFKIKNDNYFDCKNFTFSSAYNMSKNIILDIITDFTKTSLENGAIKIYILNNIEFSSIAANNSLLKILEELPANIYIIFTTANINVILPTIKSRCQLINCASHQLLINSTDNEKQWLGLKLFANVKALEDDNLKTKWDEIFNLSKEFITNDNDNKVNNYFLAKKIVNLNEEIIYFFKLFHLIAYNKLFFILFKKCYFNNGILNNLTMLWKINNVKKINYILVLIDEIMDKLKFNVNINLLLNFFLIKISGFNDGR